MTPSLRRTISRLLRNYRRRDPIQIVVWGKPDCSLCDHVHAILEKLSHEYTFVVIDRDITMDPDTFERYRYEIPVVEIAGMRRFEGKITEHWLRQELDQAASR